MAVIRIAGAATALAGVLLLGACAPSNGTDPPTPSTPPLLTEGLVIQVAHTGGFLPPDVLAARIPLVSIYADGRVITQGPQIEIFPPPALPDLQVRHVDEDSVPVLVDHALRAGVGESTDLGSPPVADAPSTRFTVVTRDETHVREVYALGTVLPPEPRDAEPPAGPPDSGLTREQQAARAELEELVRTLADPAAVLPEDAVEGPEPYVPKAVAGVVTAWTAPEHDRHPGRERRAAPWPGPPLPGEPLVERLGLSCVLATGEQARAVLEAARSANISTLWIADDGRAWSVALRPLLPHEDGCKDLLGP